MKVKGINVKKFFRRYWYWFVVIPVLIAIVFVWLYLLGVFEKVEPVVLKSNTPETVALYVDSSYRFSVAMENAEEETLKFSSSDTNIVTIDETGLMYAVAEGMAVVTASAGDNKKQVFVSVSVQQENWFLMPGESFSQKDIIGAFPRLYDSGITILFSKNDLLESDADIDEEKEKETTMAPSSTSNVTYTVKMPTDKDALFEGEYDIFYADLYGTTYLDEKTPQVVHKGRLRIFVYLSEEEREARQGDYEKVEKSNTKVPTFDKEKIDEKLEKHIGTLVSVRHDFGESGTVYYAFEYGDSRFSDVRTELSQSGYIVAYGKTTLYVTAYIPDTDYVYRYEVYFAPSSYGLEVQVNQEILFQDPQYNFESYFNPDEVSYITSSDSNEEYLVPIKEEDGNLIGYRTTGKVTKEGKYLYLYGFNAEGGVISEIKITISNLSEENKNE